MSKKVYKLDFRGRQIVVEIGEMAKQANGACLVRYGETAVLTASCASKGMSRGDFFPLQVRYEEKQYSVGKIPGGFIKREGRPTENATLTSRLIDRPIRPLFPKGFKNEVQVISTVLSVDQDNTPEMSAMLGSSLSLAISDIPFNVPIAGVVVGRVDKKFVINPTPEELENSDIDLIVAGTKVAVNMVEAGAKEVSEKDMLEAILFGHDAIKELIEFQEKIIEECQQETMVYEVVAIEPGLDKEVRAEILKDFQKAIVIKEKLARDVAIGEIKKKTIEKYEDILRDKFEDPEAYADGMRQLEDILENIETEEMRRLITKDKVRPDGRKTDELRKLDSRVDILARTHGSAMFTRGQTQALSVTTLGALGEHQILDGLGVEADKRFIHHYNFPQYSVGETGRYGAPGRREIGHGALGERALRQVIPSEEEFPYTIRIVSEILESNGSSSQASICAGCMSLMAAGVPIKAPVAGIAMGLISDGKNYTILTDIQGMEDHHGDMDFKVAGTKDGICALQMDIKIEGITKKIMKEALEQAKVARMQILDNMTSEIKESRKELSKYAPKAKMLQIKPDQIRAVIGKGGEVIDSIIEKANGVKIDIEEDGRVMVYDTSYENIEIAINLIKNITREVEPGKVYTGKVTRVEAFGCFVELWSGCEGMVHISNLAMERVEKTEDIVKVGDEIIVKALGNDKKGRLDLSRKAALK